MTVEAFERFDPDMFRAASLVVLAVTVSVLTGCATTGKDDGAKPPSVRLPPRHAGFDYQIGGAYPRRPASASSAVTGPTPRAGPV